MSKRKEKIKLTPREKAQRNQHNAQSSGQSQLLPSETMAYGLYKRLQDVKESYINASSIFPLMLVSPIETKTALKRASSLYHATLTSIQFNQLHRASWYLCALIKYCQIHFSQSDVKNAKDSLLSYRSK